MGFCPIWGLKPRNGGIAAHELGVTENCIEFSQNRSGCKCCTAILVRYALGSWAQESVGKSRSPPPRHAIKQSKAERWHLNDRDSGCRDCGSGARRTRWSEHSKAISAHWRPADDPDDAVRLSRASAYRFHPTSHQPHRSRKLPAGGCWSQRLVARGRRGCDAAGFGPGGT